jgi:SagB-type dehydrogenase family enzyme
MKKLFFALLLIGFVTNLFAQDIQLPQPKKTGGKALMDCLNERKSSRDFNDTKEISEQTLSNLLWAAWGYNRADKRTAPSSRNKQEIDIYVVLKKGVYLWDTKTNVLKLIIAQDLRKKTGTQTFVEKAPVNLIFVCNKRKAEAKTEQALTEATYANAGYISQNIYLFCASEGLATVVRGSVPKEDLGKLLNLSENQLIVLAQSVGYPAK